MQINTFYDKIQDLLMDKLDSIGNKYGYYDTDESWKQWREENPKEVEKLKKSLTVEMDCMK